MAPPDESVAVEYDPYSLAARTDPFGLYEQLRAGYRAYPLPQYQAYAIPRFDDVWQLGGAREFTSIAEGPVFEQSQLSTTAPSLPLPQTRPVSSFSMLDAPAHTLLRKAALGPFRPGTVGALEDPLRADARARIERAREAGTFDVVADVAGPAVAASTCRMLGLPVADHDRLAELAHTSLRRNPETGGSMPEGVPARQELHRYLTQWVGEARGHDGLVDALAGVELAGGPLSDDEIAIQVSTLLSGGVETVPKIVAGAVLRFWQHPDQRDALRGDRGLLAGATEEVMRLEAPLQWVGRTVTAPTEVAGVEMSPGTRLFLLLACANRDEREFPDPGRFDIRRRSERTVAFGHGTHFCIGAAPARLELQVIVDEFLRAIDDYEVLTEGIERPPSEFQLGYTAMPVRCT